MNARSTTVWVVISDDDDDDDDDDEGDDDDDDHDGMRSTSTAICPSNPTQRPPTQPGK